MNRRSFIASLSASTLSLPTATSPLPAATMQPEQRSTAIGSPELTEPPYFTKKVLDKAIDTTTPLTGITVETVAYKCPNYHSSAAQERYFGSNGQSGRL
jgi:hypothetical protein